MGTLFSVVHPSDEFEKPSRSYNTAQFHINDIWHCTSATNSTSSRFTHICNQHTSKSSTLQSSSHSPEDGQHRLTEISRHLLNLNSSFQNYHMVLPQASPHNLMHVHCFLIMYRGDTFTVSFCTSLYIWVWIHSYRYFTKIIYYFLVMV